MTRSCYDLQNLRMATGLRLVANFRARLGGKGPTQIADSDMDEEAKSILKQLRESYARLTDGIVKETMAPNVRALPRRRGFTGDGIITDYTELVLVAQWIEFDRLEKRQFSDLDKLLPEFPIYVEFLSKVIGVGPAMSAVMISEFDIHRAKYASSLWKFAGLDVGADGLGRSRRREHLVEHSYTDKAGNPAKRLGITFDPFLKTKLTGVLGPSFLRSGSSYRRFYDAYKHRIESDPARPKPPGRQSGWEFDFRVHWRKKRIHDASIRYMVKMFLADLYERWRPLEGLPVFSTYHEAKQGHVHGSAAE
jgi:hypothetical protein